MARLASCLPPLAWMAVIAWFSTGDWDAEHTTDLLLTVLRWLPLSPAATLALHALLRKLAHLTVYAILGALWYGALAGGRGPGRPSAAWLALGLTAGWAVLDEFHQSFVPSRTASPLDVGLDVAGAVTAVALRHLGWRRACEHATTALLWLGAVGGALALALDVAAGVSPGALWLTVPAAVVLLIARRRLRS